MTGINVTTWDGLSAMFSDKAVVYEVGNALRNDVVRLSTELAAAEALLKQIKRAFSGRVRAKDVRHVKDLLEATAPENVNG